MTRAPVRTGRFAKGDASLFIPRAQHGLRLGFTLFPPPRGLPVSRVTCLPWYMGTCLVASMASGGPGPGGRLQAAAKASSPARAPRLSGSPFGCFLCTSHGNLPLHYPSLFGLPLPSQGPWGRCRAVWDSQIPCLGEPSFPSPLPPALVHLDVCL